MKLKRASRTLGALVMVLLLVLIAACVPAPGEITPTPTPTPTPSPTPTPTPAPEPTSTGEKGNFQFLISDEVNAIADFQHLYVTISSIGVQRGGESENWLEFTPDITEVDLKPLVDENALEIWSGNITPGEYNKVFIYVDSVTGILISGETANVSLPSDKLQISKPFVISENTTTSFVYDITVVKAGNSGKYILKPQIAQSGADKSFNLVTAKGKPEITGKPEGKGKPEGTGKPEDRGKPDDRGKPEGQTEPGEDEAAEDTTPPVINVSGVTNGQQYSAPVTPTFEVSDDTDEEPAVVTTLNGESFTSGTVVSEPGEYELVVTAIDASGNETEVTVNFEIMQPEA